MAIPSQTSSKNWILWLRVMLVSTGVLFTAIMLKLYLPIVIEFAFSEIPSIWSFVVSWLRPPYLYVVINCIIITIVAASKLQHKMFDDDLPPDTVVHPAPINVSADYAVTYDGVDAKKAPVEVRREFAYGDDANVVKRSGFDAYERVDDRIPEMETKAMVLAVNALEDVRVQDELAISMTSSSTPQLDSGENLLSSYEKPPVSMRIGHRKVVKSNLEGGKSLRVSKPKRHDTLESTWKTITEGRSMPLARHMRKPDTWETHGRVAHLQSHDHTVMTKSEASDGRTATATATNFSPNMPPAMGRLRKEASPSQDELNRRVEAFIKKFNEEMRLQRQESLNQYMEMINRGAH